MANVDSAKQEKLDALRERESALAEDEKRTLDDLYYGLEQEEWRALGPELERLRREQVRLQQQRSPSRTQNALLGRY